MEHENGTGSAKSEINVVLSRYDIGRETSCRVNSSATKVGGMQQVSSKKILERERFQSCHHSSDYEHKHSVKFFS